ncbi:ABC transporter permease [Natrialba sp. PRR66]|uniref:ABC transporter permease n=1 Tax=Natrialba sp. PRR66 TaxID=3098146 RepID=UPI002B1E4D8B|nr:ABC transporter permease [Natrialba sp. PRR66]
MNSFHRYLLKRLVYVLLNLVGLSVVVFCITVVLPGNAAETILGRYATPENVATLERELGLHRPHHVQYLDWVAGFVTGDWGTSFRHNRPVFDLVVTRGIRSAYLAVISLVAIVAISIPAGIIAAVYSESTLDAGITGLAYVGISVPEFVTGTGLLVLFAGPVWSVFPAGGYTPLSAGGPVEWASHLVLPVITLTFLSIAHLVRLTRTEMIETLRSEYVRTARLKGLDERTVVLKHAVRNGLLPTVTLLAMNVGYLVGGVVVVEEVFAYPGLGRLLVGAVLHRDIPVLQATVLLVAGIYMFANLGADLLYTYFDPRISYGSSAR